MATATASSPKPLREHFEWDVFLSYRKPDLPAVTEIARTLRSKGIRVWFDEWCAQPGRDFQDTLADGLKASWATAVFIGPSTVGGWQEKEVKSAINTQVQSNKPVMAVFLPDVGDIDKIELPPFLGLNTRIVFKTSMADEDALNRLIWGITDKNPYETATPAPVVSVPTPPTDTAAIADSLLYLSAWLKNSGKVTFFIGPAACRIDPAFPPRDFEIARQLLLDLHVIEPGAAHVHFPIDVAATFYGIGKTDPVLEQTVFDMIAGRSGSIPPLYESLAKLLVSLTGREKPRGRRPEKQLILTSNIDVMIERALLRAGIGFTRVVQHKKEVKLHLASFRNLRTGAGLDVSQLDEIIWNQPDSEMTPEALTGSVLEEPILYKLRGSQDLPGSCALTRPQLLNLARSVIADKLVPDEMQKITANTPIVFLGTGMLAPEFQYASNTLLFKAWDSDYRKFMIQVAPGQDRDDPHRQLETGIWQEVKKSALTKNLTTVEEQGDGFLNQLMATLGMP
jgi:hypothetical protein